MISKKLTILLTFTLIEFLSCLAIHEIENRFRPLDHRDIGWGLTVYFTFIIFAIALVIGNIFFLFSKNRILKSMLLVLAIFSIDYNLFNSLDYYPFRASFLILITNVFVLMSFIVLGRCSGKIFQEGV